MRRDPTNWISDSIEACTVDGIGNALKVVRPIKKDALVVCYGGIIIDLQELRSMDEDRQMYTIQVNDELYLSAVPGVSLGIGEYLNHSCDPTCGFSSEINLVAIRDLEPGDLITVDYATCNSSFPSDMKCLCGSKKCRGIIKENDWELEDVQSRLLDYYQPYLRRRVKGSLSTP
jgi:hypothetical protein